MIRLHVWTIVLDLCISAEADRPAPAVVRRLRTLDRAKQCLFPSSPNALAVASGTILSSLLDTLVANEVLTVAEITGVLQSAMSSVTARANSAEACPEAK
jgi:hypothetical protein